MKNLQLVYDFGNQYPGAGLTLMPLLVVALGIGLYFFSKKFEDPDATSIPGYNKRKYQMVFGIIFACGGSLVSLVIIPVVLSNYFDIKKVYTEKAYQTIEGKVEDFHPMPPTGHDTERFNVNNVHFDYSDFELASGGYNTTTPHGGFIREGLYVRISYYYNGNRNVILKLAIG